MKKTGLILLTIALAVSDFSINKAYAEDNRVKAIPVNISSSDERFTLSNISFYKRLESQTMSLNANIEFQNNTDQDLKLKVIVMAFREIDSADKNIRKWFEYPTWRKRDLDKEIKKVILLDSIPAIDKNSVDAELKDGRFYPDFQKYLQYIGNNATIGSDLVIKGFNTGASQGTSQNYGNPNMFVVAESMKTSIYTKLHVKFNRENNFFNRFGVIVVDPDQKKVVSSELFEFDGSFSSH